MGSKGSSGGTTTTNTPLTKQQYDPTGYKYREQLLPKLSAKYDVGLTPEDKSYYEGKIFGDMDARSADIQKGLMESLGRAGIDPNSGAAVESMSDLKREQIGGTAGALSDLTGKDIAVKDLNLKNLMSLIADTGGAGIGSSTTTEQGGSSGGGVRGGLTGAMGGAMSGAMLGNMIPGIGTAIGALGGGILGGIGGLL